MAYINGKKIIQVVKTQAAPAVYQTKKITPQNQTHEITADAGYQALSKVILNGLLVDPHQSYTTTTDSTVAYQKSVPSGALKYATLDIIGGMSYKRENLLPNVNFTETTTNDIKWSITDNIGTFLKLEDNTTQRNYVVNITPFKLYANKTYTLVKLGYTALGARLYDTDNNTYNGTFTPTTDITINKLQWYGTTPYNQNVTVSYMVIEGSTEPTEYKPYFTGIRDSAVTIVLSYGENFFDKDNYTYSNAYINNAGVFVNDNTNSMSTVKIAVNPNTTYTFKVSENQRFIGIATYANDNFVSKITAENNSLITFTTPNNVNYILINVNKDETNISNNYLSTIEPMLVIGSTAPSTYIPYQQPIKKEIPSEITSLTGYGRIYSTLDLVNKKFYAGGYVDLGTLNYTYNSSTQRFETSDLSNSIKPISSSTTKGNIFCEIYDTVSGQSQVDNPTVDMTISQGTGDYPIMRIRNLAYTDATTFKTAMSGKYLYFDRKTPVATDVSEYIEDNFIEVVENIPLTFTNTYGQAVPSEVTYLVEV